MQKQHLHACVVPKSILALATIEWKIQFVDIRLIVGNHSTALNWCNELDRLSGRSALCQKGKECADTIIAS